MNDWLDLEHQLWSVLKKERLLDKTMLVGFSGGVDSLAVVWALFRVKKTGVAACYVHHGPGENKAYRDQAAAFCQEFCLQQGIPFHTRTQNAAVLKSEAELREFRYDSLREVQLQTKSDLLVLAHHREDLLETRLLRLIRGTGPQGLGAMRTLQGSLFRPFLRLSKSELQDYLDMFSLRAFEDPSNKDLNPLRNWLRQEWLVALEKKQKGAVGSLARSLETLAEGLEENFLPEGLFVGKFLSRPHYLSLSERQQRQALASYLLAQGKRDFSQAHLEEIQKRLDNSQKDLNFRVCGVYWMVNAQQIQVQNEE